MASMSGLMEIDMKESGRNASGTETELISSIMVINMLVNMRMESQRGKVCINGPMVIPTKESLEIA